MVELSKDADKLVCIIYKEYLSRTKAGQSKSDAALFKNANFIKENLCPHISLDDTKTNLYELARANFITYSPYNNTLFNIRLTSNSIIYMENRFKNGLNEITDFITKFKP